jgi:G8 domain
MKWLLRGAAVRAGCVDGVAAGTTLTEMTPVSISRRTPHRPSVVRVLAACSALLLNAVVSSAQSLPHNIPDFATDTSRPNVRSVQSGDWSSASTWSGGQIPTSNHVVNIDPGHAVMISNTSATAYTIGVHGTLRFSTNVNTRLTVTNLMIMGDHGMPSMTTVGRLEVGTVSAPIAANVTAEIVITSTPTGGSLPDPEQFGTGIINFGKMTMHGAVKNPTFLRLSVEPRAGENTLTVEQPVTGWAPGDRLVIPDTRHIRFDEVQNGGWTNSQNQWEELTIQSVSSDNRTITLTSALHFDHLGARDLNGALNFLPHVGNLTRNVIVRSQNPSGTRGHTISVHIADTDVRYTLFKDLGRTMYTPLNTTTNVIGRYPIHMHHNRGPLPTPANGYQFTVIGNAVDGGSAETKFKWGIAVHNSHYGLIQHNVVYNYNGSSIVTEDGSESYNVFDHNFAIRGMGEPDNSVSAARTAMGTEAVGFWFRGPNNYVTNNVAANFQNQTTEAAYGFVYQLRLLGNISIPTMKGADSAVSGQFTTRNGNNMPILQFENNEAYGAMQGGFTYWWVSSQDPNPYSGGQLSVIKNLKIWHVYNKAVYHYPSQLVTFDGLIIRGKYDSSSRCCGSAVHFSDYSSKDIVFRNSDIQGMNVGFDAPASGFGPGPNLLVENSILRNWTNVSVPTPSSVNGCWMENKMVMLKNTRLEAPPGRGLSAINMSRAVAGAVECLSKLDEVRVYSHNGNGSDNFQVYHSNSSVLPRPPASCTPITRTGISGTICPIAPLTGTTPAPGAPTNLRIIR